MITTERAIELVVAELAKRRGWSEDDARSFIEPARATIAKDPGRFVDLFLANVDALEQSRAEATEPPS